MNEQELIDSIDSCIPSSIYQGLRKLLVPISSIALRQWRHFRSLLKHRPYPESTDAQDTFLLSELLWGSSHKCRHLTGENSQNRRTYFPIPQVAKFFCRVCHKYFFGFCYSFIWSHWIFPFQRKIRPHYHYYHYCKGIVDPEYRLWWARYYFFLGRERRDAKHFQTSREIYKDLAEWAKQTKDERYYKFLRGDVLAWCEYALLKKKAELPGSASQLMALCEQSEAPILERARTCRVLAYVYHRLYSHGIKPNNEDDAYRKGIYFYKKAIDFYCTNLWSL